ncbi:hypothetical protein OE564_22970 [Aeromonas hydrophila]|uniref:hypothetical protein n=1 Tax=Aeromonas hydrophila TaxID=644 RepID=UPI0021F4E782|nr:hypothetical protein [Aeromonas hydrophila]MCV9384871.1 hypothetical protein [Aeromonas hydrophila]
MSTETRFNSLQRRIEGVEAILARNEADANYATDIAAQLANKSLDYHLSDLKAQALGHGLAHVREPLEVRLIGPSVDNGTAPTELVSKILKELSSALHRAVNKITTGNDSQKPSNVIKNMLDLRFTTLQPGSSRIFLTADSRGDLAGNVTQQTFNDVFNVFESESEEEFIETASVIGAKSLGSFHAFINEVYSADLNVELYWPSLSNHRVRCWQATRTELQRFKDRYTSIDVRNSRVVKYDGHVSLVSDSGQLRIRLGDRTEIVSTFSPELLDQVRAHGRLGSEVSASFREDSIGNSHLGILKNTYSLITFI